jgi:hypothetical protein
MEHFETPEKDVALALALAMGASQVDAAEKAGVGRTTVHRRLADPAFQQLVARLRTDFMAEALGRMARHMSRGADALVEMLDSTEGALRLRVIRALLTLSLRLHDAMDYEQRIRAIEAKIAEYEQGRL